MSIANLSLVKQTPINLIREGQGHYEFGEWVNGEDLEIPIMANVQPFTDYQTMILPEADRSKDWVMLFSTTELRSMKEGVNGWGADRFLWQGEMYEVMKVQAFRMRVRDHFEAKCARVSLTPN